MSRDAFQVISFRQDVAVTRACKRRKVHHKSNLGCRQCREKKVKCDEARPICVRCWRNKRPCRYDSPEPDSPSKPCNNSRNGKIALLHFNLNNSSHLPNGTPQSELMHHLLGYLPQILQVGKVDDILELTRTDLLVRKAVLAISATHLHRVSPSTQHKVAECFQQDCVLKKYRLAMCNIPERLDHPKASALALTGGLMNMLAFTLLEPKKKGVKHENDDDVDPSIAWKFEADDNEADWLCLQVGMHPMLHTFAPYLPETKGVVGEMFLGPNEDEWYFGGYSPIEDSIPENWAKCFEMHIPYDDPRSTIFEGRYVSDIFRRVVRVLLHLKDVPATNANVFKFLQFFGKVPPEFRQLLHLRDTKALWLYGYWLGLMCRFEGIWWCERRVRVGYQAVKRWLEHWTAQLQAPRHEQELWKEMVEELRKAPERPVPQSPPVTE